MALTDTKVRSAKTEAKEYSLVDGDGMFLLIHPNGSKYWRFRFRFGGKQHLMAFGVYPETSLADARQKREEAKRLVAAGVDPREHRCAEIGSIFLIVSLLLPIKSMGFYIVSECLLKE